MFERPFSMPVMKSIELQVTTTGETTELTPPSNKRIAIYGYWAHQITTSSATVTEEASLSFGTDHAEITNRIASYSKELAGDFGIAVTGLNLQGEIDEVVSLKNSTFSPGGVETHVILYYGYI